MVRFLFVRIQIPADKFNSGVLLIRQEKLQGCFQVQNLLMKLMRIDETPLFLDHFFEAFELNIIFFLIDFGAIAVEVLQTKHSSK